jgi:unsaturated rhamnogalacturonyl hydrolase
MPRACGIFFPGVILLGLFVGTGCRTASQKNYFTGWPAGASPAEVGKKVADNFAAREFRFQSDPRRHSVEYPEACAWYGALTLAGSTHDQGLEDKLITKFNVLLTQTNHLPARPHVDDRVFGIVPLQVFIQTSDPKFLELGLSFADSQWKRTSADGITSEARYWIDDMYMITALQVQAYRATGDAKYLDRAALTMVAYLDKLQQPNGLFFHTGDSRFFWGRGNGWVAAGMCELLRSLPETHPRRARILRGYRAMMASLLKYQSDQGLWRQLIDRPESWPESSSTGMFAFAMVTGVKRGWLDAARYGPAARKAWLGLAQCLDSRGNVRDVCAGTSQAFQEVGRDPGAQFQYYLDRPRSAGDLHGQAPMLWTASALME